MREIKFRGKRTDNKEWVYGDLVQNSVIDALIYGEQSRVWAVIPSTIGQFTGLLDKNGKEIYEGDIITWEEGYGVWKQQINRPTIVGFPFICGNTTLGEVIGNIHEVKNEHLSD